MYRFLLADVIAGVCVAALISAWCLAIIGFFATGG